jgi:hypothetical protein
MASTPKKQVWIVDLTGSDDEGDGNFIEYRIKVASGGSKKRTVLLENDNNEAKISKIVGEDVWEEIIASLDDLPFIPSSPSDDDDDKEEDGHPDDCICDECMSPEWHANNPESHIENVIKDMQAKLAPVRRLIFDDDDDSLVRSPHIGWEDVYMPPEVLEEHVNALNEWKADYARRGLVFPE